MSAEGTDSALIRAQALREVTTRILAEATKGRVVCTDAGMQSSLTAQTWFVQLSKIPGIYAIPVVEYVAKKLKEAGIEGVEIRGA